MKAEEIREFFRLRDRLHKSWLDPAAKSASPHVTETAACPLCEGQAARPWFVKGGFSYVGCASCGLGYINPRLRADELVKAHQAEAWDYFYARSRDEAGAVGWREELARIARYRKPGRLLDVAAGSGSFLAEARSAGWEVRGVEVNGRAATVARERYRVPVDEGTVESLHYRDHAFDVVTIFHALDQFYSPRATLREMYRVLVPGGLLVVTVPNIRSFIVWVLGSHHRHFTPEKGCYFTPRTLTRMVREAGFQVLSRRTFGEECTLSTLAKLARTGRSFDLFEAKLLAAGLENGSSGSARPVSWRRRLVRPLAHAVDGVMIRGTRLPGLGAYVTLYAKRPASTV